MSGKSGKDSSDEVSLMEAAVMLGEAYGTTRDLMTRGRLKGRRVGVHWLIERESVERCKAQRAAPASAAA